MLPMDKTSHLTKVEYSYPLWLANEVMASSKEVLERFLGRAERASPICYLKLWLPSMSSSGMSVVTMQKALVNTRWQQEETLLLDLALIWWMHQICVVFFISLKPESCWK